MKRRKLVDIKVESVSLIPAPKCAVCDTTMEAHDHLHWRCVCPSCTEAGKPVHTGGYPFFITTKEPGTIELRGKDEEHSATIINVDCKPEKIEITDPKQGKFTVTMPDDEPFTCPRCGAVSHNPQDKKHGYCAACGDFTRDHPDNPLPTVLKCDFCGATDGSVKIDTCSGERLCAKCADE